MRRACVLLAIALLAACSQGEPDTTPSPVDTASSGDKTGPVETTTESEPATDTEPDASAQDEAWEPAGTASATYSDISIDLDGARVSCEAEGARTLITVDMPGEPNTGYWATLWSSTDEIDVLDVGIGYATSEPVGDPAHPHSWSSAAGEREAFEATNSGSTWMIEGGFPIGKMEIPGRLEVTCP